MTKLRINLGSAATVYYTASHAQHRHPHQQLACSLQQARLQDEHPYGLVHAPAAHHGAKQSERRGQSMMARCGLCVITLTFHRL